MKPSTRATSLEIAWRDPVDAFAPLAEDAFSILLGSGGAGRWSIVAADPAETFIGRGLEPLNAASAALLLHPDNEGAAGAATGAPFRGGLAGLLSYELGAALTPRAGRGAETLGPWPDVALGRYEAAALFDHEKRAAMVIGAPKAARRLAERLGPQQEASGGASTHARAPGGGSGLSARRQRSDVEAAIARAVRYVHAGDVFQVNLSHAFDAELGPGDTPFAVFRRLTQASPAPYAAFFRLDADHVVASHSPEQFLAVDAHGQVTTRPIKGTRPRGATPEADAALAASLAASEKDRAENLMIVDLMRNDLARACRAGSVRVPALQVLESYANVHHLVSTVTGQLRPQTGALDLVRSAFPAGSVTGAPKVRAMQIIAELEGEARGPYCGSLGYIGDDGRADFSVLIRTIAFCRDPAVGGEREGGKAGVWRAEARSGGGVVADSDPAAEYDETVHKVASIAQALGGWA